MKKGKIIAVTRLLSASALICGGIFLHQYFDAQNSAAAFDELAGLVVEGTPPAPDVSDEVVAAFRFNTNRDTFRYNEYTNMDEAEFAEFLENVRARALYDTGVEVEYGDELLILSTCEYTYKNGRFVVVAKKVG